MKISEMNWMQVEEWLWSDDRAVVPVGGTKIVLVNGHGGNQPAAATALELMVGHPNSHVGFHNWCNAPRTIAQVMQYDTVASHASWLENFPWTWPQNPPQPEMRKPMVDLDHLRSLSPAESDGNFGGLYQRPDEEMLDIRNVAVDETREILRDGWA